MQMELPQGTLPYFPEVSVWIIEMEGRIDFLVLEAVAMGVECTHLTWVGGRVHSGFGGQADFVVGALHSPGGQAIVALPSWHPKADVSTVVPRLDGPATSFQHSFIVSEQGTAAIWGRDAFSQAQQIIDDIAHPSARQQLRDAARILGVRP